MDRAPDGAAGRPPLRRRLQPWRRVPSLPRLHLVIVIDEIDKLTADAAGMTAIAELLGGIKNVLTMPGAHRLA